MANNLHISYTLYTPGQDYPEIIQKIQTLGRWAKIHPSFWYVNSTLTAKQALDALRPTIDSNDSLYVVDATNNMAVWYNLPDDVQDQIRRNWNL